MGKGRSCGYYSCFKRKPTCNHPTKGHSYTKCLRSGSSMCKLCLVSNNYLYPSELPTEKIDSVDIDVLDTNGIPIQK